MQRKMTRLALAGKCVGLGASGPVAARATRSENASQPKPQERFFSSDRRVSSEVI